MKKIIAVKSRYIMTVNIIEKRIPFLLVVNVEIVAENGSFVNTGSTNHCTDRNSIFAVFVISVNRNAVLRAIDFNKIRIFLVNIIKIFIENISVCKIAG